MEILGVKIDNLTIDKVLEKIKGFLEDDKQHYIVTPNPEFLVKAQSDKEFKEILNKSDLAVPDGIGLVFASWFLGQRIKARITGADLTGYILEIAQKKDLKVFLINWSKGLSSANLIKKAVKEKYPGLRFEVKDIEKGRALKDTTSAEIVSFKARPLILFVSLGAPYQEKFIYNNLKYMPSVKLAVGVGGAFDFITGRIKRAPKLMRSIGLEWLWRLFCQPWRIKRVFRAIIKFPLLVFLNR